MNSINAILELLDNINIYRMLDNGGFDDTHTDSGIVVTTKDITSEDIQHVINLACDISLVLNGDIEPGELYQDYKEDHPDNIKMHGLKRLINECLDTATCYSELIVECLDFVYPGKAIWIDGIVSGTVCW